MAKLWQKQYKLDELIERFTVGEDYALDRQLLVADCAASVAHARMLAEAGLIGGEEAAALERELGAIAGEAAEGRFTVSRADEDGHTAIENRLTERLGEPGKKIHTGRSRNDQVITAIRLYLKAYLATLGDTTGACAELLFDRAERHADLPMVGRTHMQPAMPSTVGLWMAAYGEELVDLLQLLQNVYALVDQSPLGAAASYGVPLPLNRSRVAELLGFARVQNNVLYVNNSRGRIESLVLDLLDQLGLTLNKLATDLILFSLPEFGYFSLPEELCSGSSIMPQKRNPDGLELVRAKAGMLSGWAAQVKNVVRSLPSGYNRDFQETKQPLLAGCATALDSVRVIALTVERLTVHPERLRDAFTPEVFATDLALEFVRAGDSFREAYRKVGENPHAAGERDPAEVIAARSAEGSPGNLALAAPRERLTALRSWADRERQALAARTKDLFGRELPLYNRPE